MKKGLSEIVVIADKSGSMFRTIHEARQSINKLIDDQKKIPGEAKFTFAMFDSDYKVVYDREDLHNVGKIGYEYDAEGMTAMNDAIGRTIDHIGKQLHLTPEDDRPEKVIVAIVTDGEENSSKEYDRKRIGDMIKTQQDQFSWEFLFFGADINVREEGKSLNIDLKNQFTYDNTSAGVTTMYGLMCNTIAEYRS